MKKMKFLFLFSLLFLMSCTISARQETKIQGGHSAIVLSTSVVVFEKMPAVVYLGDSFVSAIAENAIFCSIYSSKSIKTDELIEGYITTIKNKNNKEIVPAPANLFVFSLKLPNMIASSLSVNNKIKAASPASEKFLEDVHLYSLKFPTFVGNKNFLSSLKFEDVHLYSLKFPTLVGNSKFLPGTCQNRNG